MQYLFTQSEFGLMCPISATDTSAMLIERYGDEETKARFLPGMWSQDMTTILKGAQFMTEKTGGSDVGNIELEARWEDGNWRLYGEKWFCSCADGDVALLLARPEGAPMGPAASACSRCRAISTTARATLPDRAPEAETRDALDGIRRDQVRRRRRLSARAVGPGRNPGLKQMMDQVNMSRLSHGVRAAGMMRRCLNEALVVSGQRIAFGERIARKAAAAPPADEADGADRAGAVDGALHAVKLHQAEQGDAKAERLVRILTPLLKFRTAATTLTSPPAQWRCAAATAIIEDWINARLVRDAHLGVLWEGTSNINALDIQHGRSAGLVRMRIWPVRCTTNSPIPTRCPVSSKVNSVRQLIGRLRLPATSQPRATNRWRAKRLTRSITRQRRR